jgi:phospholipase D1/2
MDSNSLRTESGRLLAGPGLFDPGRNCLAAARGPRAALFATPEAYHAAFVEAAGRAQRSIVIIGWEFDSRARLRHRGGAADGLRLGDFLDRVVRRRRELNCYILAWDYALAFGERREILPLYSAAGLRPRHRIHLHYDATHPPGAAHHQKLVVIDDALAFCGGHDLGARDPTVACGAGHDAMAMVDGEAAAVLAQVAHSRWLIATGEMLRPIDSDVDPWPSSIAPDLTDAVVAVSRTLPETEATAAVREIEALWLDLIAAARSRIYIETPYFTSQRVGEALAGRLALPEPPEIVIVTRRPTDGWLEAGTVRTLRSQILSELRRADRYGRLEVYCPRGPWEAGRARSACQSSVILVDDEWLNIGSAALANRSLRQDSECAVTFDGHRAADARRVIQEFGHRLIGLHLSEAPERVGAAIAATGSLRVTIRELNGRAGALELLEVEPALTRARTAVEPSTLEPPVTLEELLEQLAPESEPPSAGPAWGRIALIALVIAGLAAVWRYTPLSQVLAPERAIEWAREVGAVGWAPLAVMLAYTPAAFLMFPRPLLTLFAVIAFGSWLGFACALAGISLAALAAYYAGRALPRDTIRTLAGEHLNQMTEVLRRRGLIAVFAVRIVPVGPFAVVSMVAGAVRIRLAHYVAGTLLGIAPGTLMTTIFVDQLATALEDPARINYGLVAAIVIVFAGLILLVRRWFMRQRAHARGVPPQSA